MTQSSRSKKSKPEIKWLPPRFGPRQQPKFRREIVIEVLAWILSAGLGLILIFHVDSFLTWLKI